MNTPIKVLHIISNLMSGGAEAMLSKVVRTSARHVHHIVISMVDGGAIADELVRAGIPLHHMGAHRNFGTISQFGALRRLVRQIQPDLVQGWMYHGNLAASAAAFSNGDRRIPVTWNVRQSVKTLRNESLLTAMAILAGAPMSCMPRAIIYNSQHAANDHEALFYSSARRVIIPNGFDTEFFRPDSRGRIALVDKLGLPNDAIILSRVANYHLHKDYPTLLSAFAAISQNNRRAHLVLVGRDVNAKNEALNKLISALPYPERVHLMGERRDIPQIMPGFDVLLSSSSAEAFPNVIGEAMACAVPTVATDVGDCGDILGDSARLAGPRDPEALAEKALALLALDPVQRAAVGARDRMRVIERYSIEAIAAQYVALWRRNV
jgi:glycosyltransferase involved in cell wall biosynthesis